MDDRGLVPGCVSMKLTLREYSLTPSELEKSPLRVTHGQLDDLNFNEKGKIIDY